MLTAQAHNHIIPQKAQGEYMKGWYEKHGNRWYACIYWQGNKERFKLSIKGEPMFARQQAETLLGKIRADITNGVFNVKKKDTHHLLIL